MVKRMATGIVSLMIVLEIIALATMVFGAPTGGQVTEGGSSAGVASSSQQVGAVGGNVTYVNVTGTQITGRWTAFYGFISGGIRLADASTNIFYEWTITNVTNAVVYAANGSISSWGLTAGNQSVTPSYLGTTATDNYNNTYSSSEAFTSASLSVAGVNYAQTWQNGAQGTIKSYSLVSADKNTHVWAGKAIDNTSSFISGDRVDYQILAPADSTVIEYNFYLELP